MSEPGAVATGSYAQVESLIRSLPLSVLTRSLSTVPRAISRPRANRDVFARSLDLNLPIAAIALRIGRVITEQVLGPQLRCDCRKGLRQDSDVVRTINLPARSVGEFLQIAVRHQVELIQHRAKGVVSSLIIGRARRHGGWVWSA